MLIYLLTMLHASIYAITRVAALICRYEVMAD